jgi:hypothetical protein
VKLRSLFPPGGLAAAGRFFVFQVRNVWWRCVFRANALYGGGGASHDIAEQDLHDQDATADHFCAGGHGYSEGDKFALRLQLGDGVGGRLVGQAKPAWPARATALDPDVIFAASHPGSGLLFLLHSKFGRRKSFIRSLYLGSSSMLKSDIAEFPL